MNIVITGKNFKLTDGIKYAINERLEKFENLVPNNEEVRVILETKKYGQKIEVTIPINNRLIKAESTDSELYIAMDLVIDKLKRQISKYSNKLYDGRAMESIRFKEEEYEFEDEENVPTIVKRKVINSKPMSEEEAILQMELLSHKAFMFFNIDTNSTCMLYKRNDGDYGIMISE